MQYKLTYECAKPKTTATVMFHKQLFLFQQVYKQQCALFDSSTALNVLHWYLDSN